MRGAGRAPAAPRAGHLTDGFRAGPYYCKAKHLAQTLAILHPSRFAAEVIEIPTRDEFLPYVAAKSAVRCGCRGLRS